MRLPALFIGRFQPVHNGHVYALKKILSKETYFYIMIGSAQAANTPENPFSTSERIQMLNVVLREMSVDCSKYSIIPVPDIHNFELWVDYVKQYIPPFSKIYTGSRITKQLFAKKKIPVVEIPLQRRKTLSGVEIRRRIVQGEQWKDLVPEVVADLILKINGVQRVRNLAF
jgi:nicotinamide-nucleotide adenylyltransferase